MAPKCCLCLNTVAKTGLSVLNFPKDKTRREEWIKAIGRDPKLWSPKPVHRICEVHFTSSDWIDNKRKKLLKSSAIPSLHLKCNPEPVKRKYDRKKIGIRSGFCNSRAKPVCSSQPSKFVACKDLGNGSTLKRMEQCAQETIYLWKQKQSLLVELEALQNVLVWRDEELMELQSDSIIGTLCATAE